MCTPLAAKLEEESTEEQMCLRKELVTSKNLEAWLLLSLPAIFNPDSCEQLQSLYQRVN